MSNGEGLTEKLFLKLIDQMQNSDEQTLKTIEDLSQTISELVISVGKTPHEILELLRNHDNLVRDQNRDLDKVLEQLQTLIDSLSDVNTKVCTGEHCIPKVNAIHGKLEKIDQTYTIVDKIKTRLLIYSGVIGITFTISMIIIGLISGGKITIP